MVSAATKSCNSDHHRCLASTWGITLQSLTLCYVTLTLAKKGSRWAKYSILPITSLCQDCLLQRIPDPERMVFFNNRVLIDRCIHHLGPCTLSNGHEECVNLTTSWPQGKELPWPISNRWQAWQSSAAPLKNPAEHNVCSLLHRAKSAYVMALADIENTTAPPGQYKHQVSGSLASTNW